MSDALRVLIVDDDGDLREGLRRILSARGFHVDAVASASAAIAGFEAGLRPDIILLDLKLTGMTASEFRREQLLNPAVKAVPLVVLSGADDVGARAAQLSAVAHLSKPVNLDQLAAALRQHCLNS
jgi:CheY-like chemotaxis protein